MAINLDHPEADRLVRELVDLTGESAREAVMQAVRERIETIRRCRDRERLFADVARIQAFVASLPDRDTRSPDEILGYGEFGLL